MAHCNWSAENATNAYLTTLQMGNKARDHQPDVSEFISAIAAGNNSQLMVIACAGSPVTGATTSAILALVAAAHQTGGRVVCILPQTLKEDEVEEEDEAVFNAFKQVECVVGDARSLIASDYSEADFVLVDCNLESHERILQAVQRLALHGGGKKGLIVLGQNAFRAGSWRSSCGGMKMKTETQLLPIGGGLLITRVTGKERGAAGGGRCGYGGGFGRKGGWVVKVDEATGEEHVFRVRLPHGKVVHA